MTRKMRTALVPMCTLILALGLPVNGAYSQTADGKITELVKTDTKPGTGIEALLSDTARVSFTGWIYDAAAPDHKGKEIISTRNRPKQPMVQLGEGRSMKGLEQGIIGMRAGGQRTLLIPPEMGYGKGGEKGGIPADAALIFEVELLDIRPATPDF